MKRIGFIKQGLLFLSFLQVMGFSYAGSPLWTLSPLTATTISVPVNGTATVQYQMTNQSSRAHTLAMTSITGVSQITTGTGVCGNPFTLSGHASCTLSLSIDGSQVASGNTNGPIVCEQGSTLQCYRPSPSNTLNITVTENQYSFLTTSLSNLALATNGNARIITITNTGSNTAENLSISYPTWPSGTSANSTCGSSLNATDTCTITVTPGANATSSCNTPSYSAPTPGVIMVSASNVTSSPTTDVVVLAYGCIYQGGFIYSMDDTTANTGSIGGKVASLVDQAAPYTNGPQATSIIWSSNGNGATSSDVDYTAILGIDQTSTPSTPSPTSPSYPAGTPPYTACTGALDGACDSSNILSYYNFMLTPVTYYAAGLCTATINTYSDWYLPAICEMNGMDNSSTFCPSGFQNMRINLEFLIGDLGTACNPPSGTDCLAGLYWSSTESTQHFAWHENFTTSGSAAGANNEKNFQFGVRCSRALTP